MLTAKLMGLKTGVENFRPGRLDVFCVNCSIRFTGLCCTSTWYSRRAAGLLRYGISGLIAPDQSGYIDDKCVADQSVS
jgi:hypothetical protein